MKAGNGPRTRIARARLAAATVHRHPPEVLADLRRALGVAHAYDAVADADLTPDDRTDLVRKIMPTFTSLDGMPLWVVTLVAAVAELEETHSAGAVCLAEALETVPDDVRAYASGYARGVRVAVDLPTEATP